MILGFFKSIGSWAIDLTKSVSANIKAYDLLNAATEKNAGEKIVETLVQQGYNRELANEATISAMVAIEKNKHIALTKGQIAVTTALTKAEKIKNIALKAGSIALTSLGVAAASYLATKVVEHIYKQKQAQEELIEATRQASEEYIDEKKNIEDNITKYEELHQALKEANGDEEETYRIKNELFELQKELNSQYGEEYGNVNLVTGAYEEQIKALKDLNKEKATKFLTDNADGIEDAKGEMEKTREYRISGINGLDGNESLNAIISKYQDRGLEKTNENEFLGIYDLQITANAEDANSVIDDFKTDIFELRKEFEEDSLEYNLLTDIIGSFNDIDKENQTILDTYQDTYNKAKFANIVQDDVLSKGYENAINAVENYNNAVLTGDEEKIKSAREQLRTVQNGIDLSSQKWSSYAGIMNDVFDQADTRVYDFKETLTDEDLNPFKGMKDTDLRAMADYGQNGDVFDSLVLKAKEAGVSVDELINILLEYGIITGQILKEENKVASTREMITKVNALSDGFEQLDKIMESIKDEDSFDYTLLDDKALDEFKSTGKAYDEFIETVSANPKDLKKCQDAFNNLVTEWVKGKETLEGLSDETAQLTINMLKNQGIANAEEVVYASLAVQKAKVVAESEDLSDITLEEIDNLATENAVVDDAKNYWYAYFAQKMLDEVYNGQGDIEELGRMIEVLGIGTKAWNLYHQAKNNANAATGYYEYTEGQDGVTAQWVSAATSKQGWDNLSQFHLDQIEKEIQLYLKKGTSTNYSGGVKTNDTGSSGKDPKKEEIDWIERKKEILQRLHDVQEEIANNEMESYQERVDALNYLIEKDKERVEAAKNAVSQYEKAWLDASANLTEEDKKFIEQGGDIVKKYNSQELLEAGIVDSLDAGEEYIDNLKSAQDWYDKMIESQKEELAHQKESIEHQKQKIQLLRDQIAAQQDLNNAMTDQINSQKELAEIQGEYIGRAYYEDLISQSEERKSLIQEDIDRLYEQLELTEEESAERDNILVEIENCKNELIQCEVEQAELNDTIMRLPIERLQMFRDLYADIIEDMDNYRSIQEKLGLKPSKEELQTYIDLYAESIDSSLEQQAKLKDLLKNYSYGSDKYNETCDEIQSLDTEISNLIASQIELNNEMLQIPVIEMSEQIEKLGTAKTALQNSIAEDNAKGLQTTVDQYADLHSITLQQLGLYAQQKEELTKLLSVYDEESEHYKNTEQQISDIENEMSNLVQETYQWNQELLNIPIENLEKVNENLSTYSSVLDGVLSDYSSALDGVNTLIDNEIEGVQDILDALNQQNEARKIQLNLEQSLYNLRRAEEQKTTKVIRNGEVQYEANQDDLRSAQQGLADAQYDKMVYDLEQQIEALEEIKEKWQDIIDKIEEAKNLQAAEDLFGSGWQDSILADSADLRDLFQSLYESTSQEKEAVDKQIESNERISQMMNEFISRYQEGSLTYEEALNGINNLISSMEGGYSAFEQLNGMMNLDNIASLGDIASSAEAGITGAAELLEQYLGIVESNKQSVEGFETDWESMSEGVQDIIDSFNVAVNSMDGYISVFQANAEAISDNTKTWEEMKSLIKEQVDALKKAAEELEKQQKSSSKKSSGGGSSSSNSNNGDGSYIRVNGTSYSDKEGSAAELIGKYGTDSEKEMYQKMRENQINAKADKSGDEGWREAALKALDEELKEVGVKKYHKGIIKGPVGFSPLSNDDIYKFAKRVATNPLKTDEVAAILQKGELVTQPDQMSNIMRNNQLIGQMAAEQASSAIRAINNITRDNVIDCSIGEIHLHEVQNVDEFAKALSQTFASSMQQNFSKVFKK